MNAFQRIHTKALAAHFVQVKLVSEPMNCVELSNWSQGFSLFNSAGNHNARNRKRIVWEWPPFNRVVRWKWYVEVNASEFQAA